MTNEKELIAFCWSSYFMTALLFYFRDNLEQRKKYSYVAPCVLLNLLILLPVWMQQLLKRKFVIPYNTSVSTKRILTEGITCLLLFEIFFYCAHNMLHKYKFLYENVHRVHHQLKEPIGFGALYAHPIEFVLCNLLPMSIGPVVLRTPLMITLRLWLVLGTSFIVVTHSGHVPNKHLVHHLTLKGHYGTLGFLDWLCVL